MAGFCYFAECDLATLDHAKIVEWGLGYALESAPACRQSAMQTPTGHKGVFFGDSKRLGDLTPGYYPDEQEWRELPTVAGRPKIFVGYWRDRKPGPKDLTREKLVDGLLVKLADGNMWQVPEIREYSEASQQWECRLPCYLDFDQAGKLVRGRPLAQYQALWDATAPLGTRLFENDTVTDQELADCAASLLGANYAVAFPELVVLDVLTDAGDLSLIVMAACKKAKLLAWMESLQKKSESPPTSTG